MEKIKLYIIGSIATRACFDYIPKKEYQEIYNVEGIQYQSSFISLMSDSEDESRFDLSGLNKWSNNVVSRDLNKKFKEELIKIKPDYIIIDLISEIEYGVIKTHNSYITKINGKTNKLNLKNIELEEINLKHNEEVYIELFKEKIEEFKKFCKINIPNTKIIYHIAPFLYSYYEDCRVARSFVDKNLIWKNNCMRELCNICIDKDDLVIDINDKTYFATTKHKISLNPIHYETQYYIDFIDSLNFVTLKDILERGTLKCQN